MDFTLTFAHRREFKLQYCIVVGENSNYSTDASPPSTYSTTRLSLCEQRNTLVYSGCSTVVFRHHLSGMQ